MLAPLLAFLAALSMAQILGDNDSDNSSSSSSSSSSSCSSSSSSSSSDDISIWKKNPKQIWEETNSKRDERDRYVKCGMGCGEKSMFFVGRHFKQHCKRHHEEAFSCVLWTQNEQEIQENGDFSFNTKRKETVREQTLFTLGWMKGKDEADPEPTNEPEADEPEQEHPATTEAQLYDQYAEHGLVFADPAEGHGSVFICKYCDHEFFDGEPRDITDRDQRPQIRQQMARHFIGSRSPRHRDKRREIEGGNTDSGHDWKRWDARGTRVLTSLFNWCIDKVMDYDGDAKWSELLARKSRDGSDVGNFCHDHNGLARLKTILTDVVCSNACSSFT